MVGELQSSGAGPVGKWSQWLTGSRKSLSPGEGCPAGLLPCSVHMKAIREHNIVGMKYVAESEKFSQISILPSFFK